ncbi:Lipase-GDSL domain-containing protein [Mycena kentingensis (nom. inval.)]|nr:Lipase-GDSL domain-containing protein [Mycena kentingensis (nom. inval.)]
MSVLPIASILPEVCLSGRWELIADEDASSTALRASWASATLAFHLSSFNDLRGISLRLAATTERKDRWNGGTPMLAVTATTSGTQSAQKRWSIEPALDDMPETLTLWPEHMDSGSLPDGGCDVHLTLIDRASVIDIQGFVAPSRISAPSLTNQIRQKILFIGDSISCGLSPEDVAAPALPLGVLDAFPYQFVSAISRSLGIRIEVEVVAYPGISLCGTDGAAGMAQRFFCSNPWTSSLLPSSTVCTDNTKIVCIALGTNDAVSPGAFCDTLCTFVRKLCSSPTLSKVEAVYIIPPFTDLNDSSADPILKKLTQALLPSTLALSAGSAVHVTTLPHADVNCGLTKENTLDGLHPTLEGHAILGANLARILQNDAVFVRALK